MTLTNRILATLFLMAILFIPIISALPRDAELSIDFTYPQPSGNITNEYINNTYINQTGLINDSYYLKSNPFGFYNVTTLPATDLSNYYNKSTSDNRFCFANGTNTNGEKCSTNSTYPIIYNMPKSNEVYIGDRNFVLNITVPSNVYYIELSNSFLICERDSYGFVGNDCIFEYINFDDLGDNEFNTASIQFYDISGNPLYLDKTLTYYFYPDIQSLADATEEHNVKSTWLEDIKDWVNYIFFNSEGLSINNRSMGINYPHGNEIIDGKMFFSEMYGSKFIRYNNPENLSDTDIITISGYSGFPSMYFNEDDGYIYTYAVNNKTIIRINITSLSYDILGTIPVPTTSLNQAMTVNGGYVYIGYTNSVYKFNLTTNSYESNISLGIGGGLIHSIKPSPDGQYIIATSLGGDYFIRINKTDDTVSLLDISQYVTTPTDDFQAYEDYAYITGETKKSFIKINYKTMNIVKNVSGVASWFVIMDEDKKNIYTGALDGTMLRYRIEDGLSIQYELPKKTYNEGYFINEKLYLTTYTNDATIEEISLINPIIINDGQTTTFNSTQFETGEPATLKTSWLAGFIEGISKWMDYYTITEIDNRYSNNTGDQDLSGYFTLDQTTPQTITGRPIFNAGLGTPTGNNFIWGDGTLTTAKDNIIIGDGSVTMTSGGNNIIIGNGITKNGYTYGEIIIGNGAPSAGSNSASYGSRTLPGSHQFNNGNVIIGHTSNNVDPELKFFANSKTGSIKWWEDENYFQFLNFFIADNIKAMFGTSRDASIYYDGTNFIINPKVVGTGYLSVLGDIDAGANTIRTTGDIKGVHKASDGTASVADGTYTMGIGGTQNGTITVKDGIITAIQEVIA